MYSPHQHTLRLSCNTQKMREHSAVELLLKGHLAERRRPRPGSQVTHAAEPRLPGHADPLARPHSERGSRPHLLGPAQRRGSMEPTTQMYPVQGGRVLSSRASPQV